MPRISRSNNGGFTLVEVVIVAPLVLLIVGALVAMVVALTGASLRTTARGQLQNDVLAALDQIEQDIKLSTVIVDTSANQLQLRNLATDRNPLDTDRRLILANCTPANNGVPASSALTYLTQYQVVDHSLQRRLDMDKGCQGSSMVWQRHGNAEKLISATTDVELKVTPDNSRKGALAIALKATRLVAGEEVSFTGHLYVTSLNIGP